MLPNTKITSETPVIEGEFILFVELNEEFGSELMSMIQPLLPYRLVLASDLKQAFEITWRSKPCLFLLNTYLGKTYYLYNVYGIHLYDALHAFKGREDVPAIMMIDSLYECADLNDRGVVWFDKNSPDLIGTLLSTIQQVLIPTCEPLDEAIAA